MAVRFRCHRWLLTVAALAVLVALATSVAVQAAETPRRGGVLLAVIGADPPSLDPHQESTFATLQLVAPLYSTLLQTDNSRRSSSRTRTTCPASGGPATSCTGPR